MKLRPYQIRTIQSLFDWLDENETGNPVVELPTGAGKSIIIAEFCRLTLEWWPDTKILMLTHQKELIEQDARKLLTIWEDAPVGIYAASLGMKDLDHAVTFASIQSIANASNVPQFNVILVDEAHLINNRESGQYRQFINHQAARVIGLTATPYRTGQGYLTEGNDALFSDILTPVSILELQRDGYLARLTSKGTVNRLITAGLKIRGGDYVEKDLQERVNKYKTNVQMVDEIIHSMKYYDRHHVLIFCSGVDHAMAIAKLMNENGVSCGCVHGKMSMKERDEALYDFTSGFYSAMTNANILTTGFDFPDIDLIAMLRPTMSTGLYMQMVGRGLRLKSNGGDCLVLDFAGNVQQHGPIAFIEPPKKKGDGKKGVAPCKECPNCLEILPVQVMTCPSCGYEFPRNDKTYMLYYGVVNGDEVQQWTVAFATWSVTQSRKNGKNMIVCTYMVEESENKIFTKYYCCLDHEGYIKRKSTRELRAYCAKVGVEYTDDYLKLIDQLNWAEKPMYIFTQKDGKYDRIIDELLEAEVEEIERQQLAKENLIDEAKERIYPRSSNEGIV